MTGALIARRTWNDEHCEHVRKYAWKETGEYHEQHEQHAQYGRVHASELFNAAKNARNDVVSVASIELTLYLHIAYILAQF